MKIGTQIAMSESETKELETDHISINATFNVLDALCETLHEKRSTFVKRVRALHPELEGYEFKVNFKDKTIVVTKESIL
jgi:hypothetical protein